MATIVEAEKCRICGCTAASPCMINPIFPCDPSAAGAELEPCTWLDFDHTLCTNLRCLALVPIEELERMPIMRWM